MDMGKGKNKPRRSQKKKPQSHKRTGRNRRHDMVDFEDLNVVPKKKRKVIRIFGASLHPTPEDIFEVADDIFGGKVYTCYSSKDVDPSDLNLLEELCDNERSSSSNS